MFLKKLFGVQSRNEQKEKRKAFRVALPQMRVKLSGKPASFSLRDLSATGVSFNGPVRQFPVGGLAEINLFIGSQIVVGGLRIKVVRHGDGFVGCVFVDPDREKSKILHEIVLEEQKKLADIKKKEGEKSEAAKAEAELRKAALAAQAQGRK